MSMYCTVYLYEFSPPRSPLRSTLSYSFRISNTSTLPQQGNALKRNRIVTINSIFLTSQVFCMLWVLRKLAKTFSKPTFNVSRQLRYSRTLYEITENAASWNVVHVFWKSGKKQKALLYSRTVAVAFLRSYNSCKCTYQTNVLRWDGAICCWQVTSKWSDRML